MHEAPKYFRSDFMPREMERLASAEAPQGKEKSWKERAETRRRKRKNTKEKEGWRKGGGSRSRKRVARRALGQSTPPHVLAMRG